MKFISTTLSCVGLSSIISSVNAVSQQADIFYNEQSAIGPSMWNFGPDGLTIFSPEGNVIKKHRKESLCIPYMSRGTLRTDCSFFDVTSDGHRYVWTAGHHNGQHHIGAFDIDTGIHAGDQDTCSTPLDIKYLTSRRELIVRCAQKVKENEDDEEYGGEIDIFSSGDLGANHIQIPLNGTSRPYGRLIVNSALGPHAYVTSYNMPIITEIDIAKKAVTGKYEVPKASGTYAVAFSPKNGHLFARTRICCSCGTPTSDVESCGYGAAKQVLVQTGPDADLMNKQNGTCGTGCLGSSADTIGAVEFDSITKTIVAQHNIKDGSGFGSDPYVTPNGEYIVLMPNDGGEYVRVMKPGEAGAPSTLLTDIHVQFKGGVKGKMVVSDFAFLTGGRNILVLAASTDNDIVLVDFDDNFRMKRINLSPLVEESTAESKRQVEWAIGTNFVWVNGEKSKEQYIIEIPMTGIDDAQLSRTLVDVTSQKMIFVDNYERTKTSQRILDMSRMTDQKTEGNSNNSNNSNNSKDLSVGAMVLGSVALAVALVALAMVVVVPKTTSTLPEQNQDKDGDIETKTLGSKQLE